MSDQHLRQQRADTVAAAAARRAHTQAQGAAERQRLTDFYARERAQQGGDRR